MSFTIQVTVSLGQREYALLSRLLLDPAKIAELQAEVDRQAAVSANVDQALRDQKAP